MHDRPGPDGYPLQRRIHGSGAAGRPGAGRGAADSPVPGRKVTGHVAVLLPAEAARDDLSDATEGWRRQLSREEFGQVPTIIAKPNLPYQDDGLLVASDPVAESATPAGPGFARDRRRDVQSRRAEGRRDQDRGDRAGRARRLVGPRGAGHGVFTDFNLPTAGHCCRRLVARRPAGRDRTVHGRGPDVGGGRGGALAAYRSHGDRRGVRRRTLTWW